MVRYLIQKPVALLLCFAALMITGLVLLKKIPVSLLPDVDVPRIIVQVNYPNTAAAVLEENVVKNIREQLSHLDHLNSIESSTADHTAVLNLGFAYGTRMDLAYIAVNEKIDHLANALPRDMPRPQVMRVNTSDIPVTRIQVTPGVNANMEVVSELTVKVLKKRLEQLRGVSVIDINGLRQQVINIIPDKDALHSLDENESVIVDAVRNANRDPGSLSIKDGHYRYFAAMGNPLETIGQLGALPVRLKQGNVVPLRQLATIEQVAEKATGYHLLNGKEGLVITVQKQSDSQMNTLMPAINKMVEAFRTDYPDIDFSITQDQTFLLDAGISNLYQDIVIGGILTIALLFLFLGNLASPVLMSISIPLSLIFTVIFFYFFHISFNIISLSGLALGIGMLIDNSIVVIDSITRKHVGGMNPLESSVHGTHEVMVPVISQVLTTVAVYAPLVLLSGIAGTLITDQSVALTISLCVSLLVAFILTPLLYRWLLKKTPEKKREDTLFYKWVARRYHQMINHILAHRARYMLITLVFMPLGFIVAAWLPVTALPAIEKKESLALIDWNAPIDAQENKQRIQDLQNLIKNDCSVSEAEAGIQQFLLQQRSSGIQQAELYYSGKSEREKLQTDDTIRHYLLRKYPAARLEIIDAPNAFTGLFSSVTPYLEARFRATDNSAGTEQMIRQIKAIAGTLHAHSTQGPAMDIQQNMEVMLDYDKMALYGVERVAIEQSLQALYGTFIIAEIKRFGEVKPVYLHGNSNETGTVVARNGVQYPLSLFVTMRYASLPRFITGDRAGTYDALLFGRDTRNVAALQDTISTLAKTHHLQVSFSGTYFEDKEQIKTLWGIFLVVVMLLYIILAIQYEDLVLPLIVMLTIPLGISGSMLLLWCCGQSLNIMTCVGFIVILGLIVDDPTLKIEVLNRLDKAYREQGLPRNDALLERMIHEAGEICLKPLLMVSLTTSIAMVPVLFISGIGNDLQKPMAYVIIGGLTIGTFFTTWFIPLAYWYVSKWRQARN